MEILCAFLARRTGLPGCKPREWKLVNDTGSGTSWSTRTTVRWATKRRAY